MDPETERMLWALQKIAVGRLDCGRPLPAYDAREVARQALVAVGQSWHKADVVASKPPCEMSIFDL